jgi:hypothetical protein
VAWGQVVENGRSGFAVTMYSRARYGPAVQKEGWRCGAAACVMLKEMGRRCYGARHRCGRPCGRPRVCARGGPGAARLAEARRLGREGRGP